MNVRTVEGPAITPRPGADSQDIWEVELLLPADHVRDLIEAARQQGLTAGALARQLIGTYLHQRRVTESA
jgi:hypothetical protein